MPDPAIKEKAKSLFVESGFSIETILKMLTGEVSKKTLYNWRNEEQWDDIRRSKVERGLKLRDRMEALLERAITECETNFTANNLFAVGKAAEAFRKATFVNFSDEKNDPEVDKAKGISEDTLKKLEHLMGG